MDALFCLCASGGPTFPKLVHYDLALEPLETFEVNFGFVEFAIENIAFERSQTAEKGRRRDVSISFFLTLTTGRNATRMKLDGPICRPGNLLVRIPCKLLFPGSPLLAALTISID